MQRDSAEHQEETERLTFDVIRAIAEHEGTDPTDLELPLAEVVDPEALARLFSPRGGSADTEGYVVFRYDGCRVMVDAAGRVEVFEASERPPRAGDSPDDPRFPGAVD